MNNPMHQKPGQPGYPSRLQLTKLQILAISGLACTLTSCDQQQRPIPTGGVYVEDRISPPTVRKGSHEGQSTENKKTSHQGKPTSTL